MIDIERLGRTLDRALSFFGDKEQQIKTCEELGELQAEIFKSLKGKADKEHITEEIVDVLVCVEYLKKIHDISDYELDNMFGKKVDRLIKLLDEEEKKRYPQPEY